MGRLCINHRAAAKFFASRLEAPFEWLFLGSLQLGPAYDAVSSDGILESKDCMFLVIRQCIVDPKTVPLLGYASLMQFRYGLRGGAKCRTGDMIAVRTVIYFAPLLQQ